MLVLVTPTSVLPPLLPQEDGPRAAWAPPPEAPRDCVPAAPAPPAPPVPAPVAPVPVSAAAASPVSAADASPAERFEPPPFAWASSRLLNLAPHALATSIRTRASAAARALPAFTGRPAPTA